MPRCERAGTLKECEWGPKKLPDRRFPSWAGARTTQTGVQVVC
jgi:hypothetical protein